VRKQSNPGNMREERCLDFSASASHLPFIMVGDQPSLTTLQSAPQSEGGSLPSMVSPRTQYHTKLESLAQGGIIVSPVKKVKSKRPRRCLYSPDKVLEPTLHLDTKGTKQQRNYKRAQHSYHSKTKFHRRSSQPGGIYPPSAGDGDVVST
jgi:hypothetical protein